MEKTKEVINEQRFTMLETKLDNLIDDVKEISKDLKEHIGRENEKYEKLDTKYSAKWVETMTLTIAGGLIVTIIGGIALFILKI